MALATAATTRSSRRIHVTESRSAWLRLDWLLILCCGGLLTLGTLLVWSSTAHNVGLTGGDSTALVTKHLTNMGIGIGLAIVVAATDHRWVRIWTPLVYLGAIVGLVLVLSPFGSVINGSRSWILIGGMSLILQRALKWDPVRGEFPGDEQANRLLSYSPRAQWRL